MKRRSLLSTVGVGITATVAGCLSDDGADRAGWDGTPAERRLRLDELRADDRWIGRYRTVQNDLVSGARPPRRVPEERWSLAIDDSLSQLAVIGDEVYASTRTGTTVLGLADGEIRAELAAEGRTHIVADRRYVATNDAVACYPLDDEEPIWRHEPTDWTDDDRIVGQILEFNGIVYISTTAGLECLNPDTGDRRGAIELDETLLDPGRLVPADGVLHWFTARAYRRLATDGPNEPERAPPVGFEGISPEMMLAPVPVLAEPSFYVGGHGRHDRSGVFEVDASGIRWYRPVERLTLGPAVLPDQLVVVGYDNSTHGLDESVVLAIDRETKETLWNLTLPEPVGPPAIGTDTVVLGGGPPFDAAESAQLFAIDVATGEVLWSVDTPPSNAGYRLALAGDRIVVGERTRVAVFA